MENNFEKMYYDLNGLLEDICKFLSGDKLEILSPKDKRIAESLIERSKVQLLTIARIQQPNDEYVDMDMKKVSVIEHEEEKHNIYSSVDDNCSNLDTSIDDNTIYPYKDLPAKETSTEVKYGEVFMRRRFLLGFEKMKRVYATIHNGWLLIYCSVKELKPLCMFDLKRHEAKEGDNDKCCNFEMTRTEDKKVYFFMAQTPKDVKQWVAEINKWNQGKVPEGDDNNVDEETDGEEYYVSIKLPDNSSNKNNEDDDEEEDIYFELDMVKPIPQNNNSIIPSKISDVGPPLPGRWAPLRNAGIPVPPPTVKPLPTSRQNSNTSIVSYDDIKSKEVVHNTEEQPMDDTFSESDDEDAVYESFVDVIKIKNQNEKNSLPIVNVKNVDIVQDRSSPEKVPDNPVLSLKPKVKEKPPVAPKKHLFGTFPISRQYNFKNH